jgi:hypothetical protein
MNREDIIRMAREAALFHFYDSEGHCTGVTEARLVTEDKERNDERLVEILAPFAALVAAYEREECAKVCETMARRTNDIRRAALEMAVENIMARGQA